MPIKSLHPFLGTNSVSTDRNRVSTYHTTLQTALKQYNPATQTSKSLQAKSDPSGYQRSLLITKINSCFPNTFHMSCPFQCHRTTSLAVQAVNYISKIVIVLKKLSVSHVTYSFAHSSATRLPSAVRPVVYTRFGLDRQILIHRARH
jgi:hypothetical protein